MNLSEASPYCCFSSFLHVCSDAAPAVTPGLAWAYSGTQVCVKSADRSQAMAGELAEGDAGVRLAAELRQVLRNHAAVAIALHGFAAHTDVGLDAVLERLLAGGRTARASDGARVDDEAGNECDSQKLRAAGCASEERAPPHGVLTLRRAEPRLCVGVEITASNVRCCTPELVFRPNLSVFVQG